jgi:hypothetical protein
VNAGKRKVGINAGAVMCVSAFFLLCQPHPVLRQALFYQGKTITVIAGQEPGGLGDLAEVDITVSEKAYSWTAEYCDGIHDWRRWPKGRELHLSNRSSGRPDARTTLRVKS